MLPESRDSVINRMIVNVFHAQILADSIRQDCVRNHGIGGRWSSPINTRGRPCKPSLIKNFHKSLAETYPGQSPNGFRGLPDIIIYSRDSIMRRFFDLKFRCSTDDLGSAQCHNIDPAIQKQETSSSETGGTSSSGSKQSCSGSCMDPDDCDIKNDCLCASTKGTNVLPPT